MKMIFLLSIAVAQIACSEFKSQNDSAIANPESVSLGPAGEPIDSSDIEEVFCLPVPSDDFLKWKMNDFSPRTNPYPNIQGLLDPIHAYLLVHTDSVNSLRIDPNDTLWNRTTRTQKFKNGIEYKSFVYHEIGSGGALYTKCTDQRALVRILAPIIYEPPPTDSTWYDPKMMWKDDSTRYAPEDDGVGCHYEFKTDSLGYNHVEWYCGC